MSPVNCPATEQAPTASNPPSLPTEGEVTLARESSRLLAACLGSGPTARLRVIDGQDEIEIPVRALRLLVDILAQMGEGRGVTILPIKAELTTQQAANVLNVSRPYLVNLLERKELPFRKVGKHRRVPLESLLAYQQEARKKQEAALDALAKQAQELGMGY
ncbi:MAG: helix-turn-helix domain-containing protein [Gammaproteobacteria bacterium]